MLPGDVPSIICDLSNQHTHMNVMRHRLPGTTQIWSSTRYAAELTVLWAFRHPPPPGKSWPLDPASPRARRRKG